MVALLVDEYDDDVADETLQIIIVLHLDDEHRLVDELNDEVLVVLINVIEVFDADEIDVVVLQLDDDEVGTVDEQALGEVLEDEVDMYIILLPAQMPLVDIVTVLHTI